MQNTSTELPRLEKYSGIIDAAHKGELVIFIGAGVSKLVGYCSWKEYANKKVDWLFNNKVLTSFLEKKELKELDAKKELTLCNVIMEKSGIVGKKSVSEMKEIELGCLISDPNKVSHIYDHIIKMGSKFVTTNYDECLDWALCQEIQKQEKYTKDKISSLSQKFKIPTNVFWEKEDITAAKLLLPGKIVMHIHGSINNHTTMVVTTSDYIRNYVRNGNVDTFLSELFNNYTVLFIGYGLEELEILEYIVSRSKSGNNHHYLLFPTISEAARRLNYYRNYFESLGITLIPYFIDTRGYDTLEDVLKNWADTLSQTLHPISYEKKLRFIDRIVLDKENISDIAYASLKEIINNSDKDSNYLRKYFFGKSKNLNLLKKLYNDHFFVPNEAGRFPTPLGELTYLKTIAEVLSTKPKCAEKTELETLIINIIKELTQKCKKENHEDYLTGLSLFQTIKLLPPESYTITDLQEVILPWTNHGLIREFIDTLLPTYILKSTKEYKEKFCASLNFIFDNFSDLGLDKYTENYTLNEFIKNNISSIVKNSIPLDIFLNPLITQLRKIKTTKLTINNRDILLSASPITNGSYSISCNNENLCTIETSKIDFDDLINAIQKRLNNYNLSIKEKKDVWIFYWGLFNENVIYSIYYIVTNEYSDTTDISIRWVILYMESLRLFNKKEYWYNLKYLLQSNFIVLKKIGLYLIGKYYSITSENMFFKTINSCPYEDYLFCGFGLEDELKHVLEKIKSNDKNKSLLRQLVIKGDYFESNVESNNIWKSERLNSLKNVLPKEYKEIVVRNHLEQCILRPGVWDSELKEIKDSSPFTSQEINNMSINKLVKYMATFKSGNVWNNEPTASGLAATIEKAVEEQPTKYIDNIDKFRKSKAVYITHILRGLRNYLSKGKIIDVEFNWPSLIDFISSLSNSKLFGQYADRSDSVIYQDYDFTNILKEFNDLCEISINNGFENLVSKKNITPLFSLLIGLLEKLIPIYKNEKKILDTTYLINDVLGQLLRTTLSILCNLKMNKNTYLKKAEKFLLICNRAITKKQCAVMYSFCGCELQNLYFINQEYAKKIVKHCTTIDDSILRSSFLFSFLSRPGKRFKQILIDLQDLYELYLQNDFAGETEYGERNLRRIYIRDITIMFFYHFNSKSDELFKQLIGGFKSDDIRTIIDFFADPQLKYTNESNYQKLYVFWQNIVNHCISKKDQSNESELILSETVKLGIAFKSLNEKNFALLAEGTKFCQKHYTAHSLLSFMVKLANNKEKNIILMAKLFLKMCDPSEHLITYEKENLKTVYDYIKSAQNTEANDILDEIKNNYLRQGIDGIF